MRIIRKVVSKIFELFLPIIDRVAYINFFNQPFSNLPVSDLKTYEELSKKLMKILIQLRMWIYLKKK